MLAETPEDLQKLLKEVEKFGNDVKMKFSSEKSKIMIVNQKREERVDYIRRMNGKVMEIVSINILA